MYYLITGKKLIMTRHTWESERIPGIGVSQVPLILAWALTIHKSQGHTFDNIIVDLGRGAFAHGQVYVGLSRCRTLNGISLERPIRSRDIIFDKRIYGYMDKFTKC